MNIVVTSLLHIVFLQVSCIISLYHQLFFPHSLGASELLLNAGLHFSLNLIIRLHRVSLSGPKM